MRVESALRLAACMENVSRVVGYREPPLTQFGVESLAYSKTFDVSKALGAFGPPPIPLKTGAARFVEWQLRDWNDRPH